MLSDLARNYPTGVWAVADHEEPAMSHVFDRLRDAIAYGGFSEVQHFATRVEPNRVPPSTLISKAVFEATDRNGWCAFPWGADGSALMIAICSNDTGVTSWIRSELIQNKAFGDLLISEHLLEGAWLPINTGVIFRRRSDLRGEGVWDSGFAQSASVNVLHVDSARNVDRISRGTIKVMETTLESFGQRLTSVWLNVADEKVFAKLSKETNTVLAVSGSLSNDELNGMLINSLYVADEPVKTGVALAKRGVFVYIPQTEYEKNEILIAANASVLVHYHTSILG